MGPVWMRWNEPHGLGFIVEGSRKWPSGQNMRKDARQGKENSNLDDHSLSETTVTLL